MFSNGLGVFHVFATAAIGYFFIICTYKFKYQAARKTGQHLYLSSIAWGLLFLICASAILYGLQFADKVAHFKNGWSNAGLTTEIHFWTLAGLLALFSAVITNLFQSKHKCLQNEANELDKVVYKASIERKPIQVTTDTRKVYIGMVADTFEPSDENSYLAILPIYSGYRTEGFLEMKLTNKYPYTAQELDQLKQETFMDLSITIPRSRIVTCHIFNLGLFSHIQDEQE